MSAIEGTIANEKQNVLKVTWVVHYVVEFRITVDAKIRKTKIVSSLLSASEETFTPSTKPVLIITASHLVQTKSKSVWMRHLEQNPSIWTLFLRTRVWFMFIRYASYYNDAWWSTIRNLCGFGKKSFKSADSRHFIDHTAARTVWHGAAENISLKMLFTAL